MTLTVQCLTVGPLMENCYLVADEAKGQALLIDPGDEAPRLLAALEPYALAAVLLTHAHFDHLGALEGVLRARPAPVYLHPVDRPLYEHAAEAAARWEIRLEQPSAPTEPLEHGQTLGLLGRSFVCLHTPGHAPGHVAFHLPMEGLLFAGDALFQGSIGRTDLPFGDYDTLIASIREHLLPLPDDTRVLSGHGPETTVGRERRSNPFLR